MAMSSGKRVFVVLFTLIVFFGGVYSVSATPSPARAVNGLLSNVFSMALKWVLSMKNTSKTALNRRPMMKFEGGYNVETVFDGSKLGIEPHSVEVLSDGDLLILDSANCNLYKISGSLSLHSRPRLVSGSGDGVCGYVDGRWKDARMNHPRGLTADDRGNIYVADTDNMAIRKISDTGVTTIAGGKRGRGGAHVDGPSEEAKFSDDFDVVYVGSSCSLLVIDRGNKAIREIQLRFEDCAYQYESSFPIGITVLLAAGFFGYMLALLQQRIGSTSSSSQKEEDTMKQSVSLSPYQKSWKPSVQAVLNPAEHDQEKQGFGFMGWIGKLATQTVESAADMFRNRGNKSQQFEGEYKYHPNYWPVQESFVIPNEDQPPSLEPRTPTPKKTYAFMTRDSEKMQQLRQSRAFCSGWEGEYSTAKKHQQHPHQYISSSPQTYYEQSSETTNEIVFGAVQEERQGPSVVIKPLDYGMVPLHENHNFLHSRFSYKHAG